MSNQLSEPSTRLMSTARVYIAIKIFLGGLQPRFKFWRHSLRSGKSNACRFMVIQWVEKKWRGKSGHSWKSWETRSRRRVSNQPLEPPTRFRSTTRLQITVKAILGGLQTQSIFLRHIPRLGESNAHRCMVIRWVVKNATQQKPSSSRNYKKLTMY